MTKLKISNYSHKDFQEVKSLILNIFEEKGWPTESIVSLTDFKSIFHHKNDLLLIGKMNDKIVATGGLIRLNDNHGLLTKMYVIKKFRGKSFGSRILHRLENYAGERMYNTILLRVVRSNKKAIKFYSNKGYKQLSNNKLDLFNKPYKLDFFSYMESPILAKPNEV